MVARYANKVLFFLQKLVFSNVNLKLVAQMCPLNSVAYRDCLAMSDGQSCR